MAWVTKDGSKIKYKKLSDVHLINILNMYFKCGETQLKNAQATGYPTFSGEMAQYYAEQEYDVLLEMDTLEFLMEYDKHFKKLAKQAVKRKLVTNWKNDLHYYLVDDDFPVGNDATSIAPF